MVARAGFGAFVATFALAGCYDMERLEPGPESYYLLIDDFKDGDFKASVPGFDYWKGYPFNKGPGADDSIGMEESGSDYALVGNFVFTDPGGGDFTGASIGIADTRELLDVRRYRALHVSVRFDHGSRLLPGNTRFYAELGCNSVVPIENAPSPYYVQQAMEVTRGWQTFHRALDRFVEPSPEEPRIAGGPPACLAAVDSIRFTISMSLGPDAESGGTFAIDDVYFE